MSDLTSEKLAHRISQQRLVDTRDLEQVFAEVGGHEVDLETFERGLIQREWLTNWQLERLKEGQRSGFFYGNWKVLYLVGAGTFARVYRAAHIKTGEMKAVKVLRKRYADDELTRERFEREAKTVLKLRHPNIVPIHEVDTFRGRLYMVMDFIEGQNLRDFLRAQGKLNLTTVLRIVRDVCSGLDYAYQRGVFHRDIKLSNILLASTGRALLVDFGLAGIEDETRQNVFHPRSVDYAGLEKTTNVSRNDKRSDIFFLGCVLYQLLCGKSPLLETRERMRRMSAERFRDIEPITNLLPNLPNRVVILLSHLMHLDPEKRLQSPQEALNQISMVIEAIETGDYREYDRDLSQEELERFQRRMRKKSEGRGYTVMVIESAPRIQDALRDKLKRLGYRVLILSDPARALQRFSQLEVGEDLPAHCVLFGCAGLGRDGLEAFRQFDELDLSTKVPAVLLLPADQMAWLKTVELKPNQVSIPLPIKFPAIRKTLKNLLDIPDPEPSEPGAAVATRAKEDS